MNQNPKFMSIVCFIGLFYFLLFLMQMDLMILWGIMYGVTVAAARFTTKKPLNVFSD